MSIVVAVRKGNKTAMVSDSLSTFGSHKEDQANIVNIQKIIRVGPVLLGFTGWGLYNNIFTHYLSRRKTPPRLRNEYEIFSFFIKFLADLREKYTLVNDQAQSEKDPFADIDSSFIVANRKGIFGISSNLSVCEFRHFHAIGSGCDYAFGALSAVFDQEESAAAIAKVAVEAATRFDSDCGGEIVSMTL